MSSDNGTVNHDLEMTVQEPLSADGLQGLVAAGVITIHMHSRTNGKVHWKYFGVRNPGAVTNRQTETVVIMYFGVDCFRMIRRSS